MLLPFEVGALLIAISKVQAPDSPIVQDMQSRRLSWFSETIVIASHPVNPLIQQDLANPVILTKSVEIDGLHER